MLDRSHLSDNMWERAQTKFLAHVLAYKPKGSKTKTSMKESFSLHFFFLTSELLLCFHETESIKKLFAAGRP